jgi:type IV secretory pathway protease TraF
MGGSPPSAAVTTERRSARTYHRGPFPRKALGLVALFVAVAAALARWRPSRVEIVGGSMRPSLEPGEWALVISAPVRRGDVVVLEHPDRAGFELVKRVLAVAGEPSPTGFILEPDTVWVQGDARDASTDSRSFGAVPVAAVRGRVVLVYHPFARRRAIRRRRDQELGGTSVTCPTVTP